MGAGAYLPAMRLKLMLAVAFSIGAALGYLQLVS